MNGSGGFPDISKLVSGSVNLAESLSMYENVGDADSAVSFGMPGSQTAAASNVYSTYTARSMDSSAADPSEDDTDDEDDDEILTWVAKGMLPANMETTLALNQAYQEILEQCCRRVESILVQVRERHSAIQGIINKKCNVTSKNRTAKVPAMTYMYPYFRDSADMCPPLNIEAKRKIDEVDDFNLLAEPPLKWSKTEKQKLIKAVKTFVLQQKAKPLMNKKELLNEKMKLASNEAKIKEFAEEIKKIDREYNLLIKAKTSELSADDEVNDIDWNQISIGEFDGVRTVNECRLMWNNELSPKINQDQIWSKDELKKLQKLAVSYSGRNWDEIAAKLNTGRTAFQCAEKYQSELNDDLIKKSWTPEDDATLKDGVEKIRMGDFIPWDQILLFMDGRTRIQCQTRWNRSVNPKLKHGRWTDEEDKLLLKAVDSFGEKDWSKIARCVQTRSDSQCRERWCTALDDNVKLEPWTSRDDATLLFGVKTFGVGSWAKIKCLLPGRTPSSCKVRYRTLKGRGEASLSKIKQEDQICEGIATICRRANQKERKDRVRRWYVDNHGRLPSVPQREDISTFIKSLPAAIQNVVSQKLVAIQTTYGVQTFGQSKGKIQPKTKRGVKAEHMTNQLETPPDDHRDIDMRLNQLKAMDVAYDQERSKKVDKEIMMLLVNSTWPTVSSYPFAKDQSKEESMRKTLVECLSGKKILPPTKSTLLGFKGLLYERPDLITRCEEMNVVDPLVRTTDAILLNYFDDKDKGHNSRIEEKDKVFHDVSHQASNLTQVELVSPPMVDSIVNNSSFKYAESLFRSMFLWPAIMSSMDETN